MVTIRPIFMKRLTLVGGSTTPMADHPTSGMVSIIKFTVVSGAGVISPGRPDFQEVYGGWKWMDPGLPRSAILAEIVGAWEYPKILNCLGAPPTKTLPIMFMHPIPILKHWVSKKKKPAASLILKPITR